MAFVLLAGVVLLWQNLPGPFEPPPATPTKLCAACQQKKTEEDFSKKQWKARQVRRCIACATPAAAGPTPDQTDLVERLRLTASQRSSLDAEAEDEARRRRLGAVPAAVVQAEVDRATAARRAAQRARRVETAAAQRARREEAVRVHDALYGRRRRPVEPGVSVRVAEARLARGAKRAAQYQVVRGKHTIDTRDDLDVWTEICEEKENWDPDSSDEDEATTARRDHLALAVGILEEDLPYMRRRLGDAHPEVLAFKERLGELRAALRAREASRLARE